MDCPLGFLLTSNYMHLPFLADVHGLSVNYEIYDEAALLARTETKMSADALKTTTDLSSLLPPSRYDNVAPAAARRLSRIADAESKDLRLKELDFINCLINKTSVRKFVMKNNSGIRTGFSLRSKNFEPLRHLDQIVPPPPPANSGPRETPSSKRSKMEMTEQCKIKINLF